MYALQIKFLTALLLIILTVSLPMSFADTSHSNVDTYQIYYRTITDDILEDMKNFDMVIIEALQLEPGMVETLKHLTHKSMDTFQP